MNIGGGNPKLSSNLKHSKASLKKLYKSRLTYKNSWEEKYFLYVSIGAVLKILGGGNYLIGGGTLLREIPGSPPPPPLYQTLHKNTRLELVNGVRFFINS